MPEPLRKYLPGAPEFVPFTREAPAKEAAAPKTKAKAEKGAKSKAGAGPHGVVQAATKAASAATDHLADKLKDTKV